MTTQSETLILRAIRAYLVQFGWLVIRLQQGLGCRAGLSDLVAIRDGKHLWLEVKTATGRQSDAQLAFEHELAAHGAEYHLVRSVADVALLSQDGVLL